MGEERGGAGSSVINSRLKQRATPEDSPLIHAVVLQARTSLPGDMKHKHSGTRTHGEKHRSDSHDYPKAHKNTHIHVYIGI